MQRSLVALDCPTPNVRAAPGDVRTALADAGYTSNGLLSACGCADVVALVETDATTLADRCAPGALAGLVRLFLAGATLERTAARRALGPIAFDACADVGLLGDADGWVVARARLLPLEGLLLASDFRRGPAAGFRPDYVMSPDASSLTLAAMTVRRPHRRTLDVATGCGAQALLAASHGGPVVASDRNPRAIAYTAFNAWLNDVANVAVLAGDFLAPIGRETFDLVVCNPPFVIAPMRRLPFAPGDGRADDLSRDLVRAIPPHLVDRGIGQLFLHWAHVTGDDGTSRVAAWCAAAKCDALLVRTETVDADRYVERWSDAAGTDAWRRYFARTRIEAVSAGVLTLRRRAASPSWFRLVDAPTRLVRPAGEDVLRMIAGIDLATATDDALLDARLAAPAELRLEQRSAPGGDGWRVVRTTLRLDRALAFTTDVDPALAELLGRCDGSRPLRDVIGGAASGFETASVAAAIRPLLERGFLVVR